MQDLTLADALRAWASCDLCGSGTERVAQLRIHVKTVRALAAGRPLSPATYAAAVGLALEQVPAVFARFRAAGLEFDDEGNLVGAALTLRATPHRFHLADLQLFAWCSLDTLFLPGLLEAPAQIESSCPVTGEPIRLRVTPDRVESYLPTTTVLSIVLPGISCSTDRAGPLSCVCSQMLFFAHRTAAQTWMRDRPGLAVLSVEDAFELARQHFIEPARRAVA
jgi:alkylmercury lyase